MEFFPLIPLTAAVVNLILGLLVISQGPKIKLNLVYFLWALALVVWNSGTTLTFFAENSRQGLQVVRYLQTGVICLPFFLYHLTAIICNSDSRRKITLLYLGLALYLTTNFSGHFVNEVRFVESLNAYYTIGGIPYYSFLFVFTFLCISAVLSLHQAYRRSSPFLRRRIQALLFSNYLIVAFGTNDLLPIIGFYKYPFTEVDIIPIGSAAAIFYGLIVGYSVLQSQLLDVRLTISRSMANFLRSLQITLLGFALLVVASVSAPKNTFTFNSIIWFTVVLALTGIVAAIFLPRLFGSGVDKIEKFIQGAYFEYQDRVAEFISTLPWYTNFAQLFEDLEVVLTKVIGVARFKIVLVDATSSSFTVFQSFPKMEHSVVRPAEAGSRIFETFQTQTSDYLQISELELSKRAVFESELQHLFNFANAEICLPFRVESAPFGLLLLSSKSSQDPFSKSDLNLLTKLVRSLSLVVNQIRLQEQINAEQELDLLGRISKGLAHDLNNLLTPVATLLQVSTSTPTGDAEVDDLVATADRNVTTMRKYIRDSLFFSKNLKPQLSEASLGEVTQAAIHSLLPQSRQRGISIAFDPGIQVEAVLDTILFQRLIANLVSNAIDASPHGSSIGVEVQLAPGRDGDSEWIQLKVIDHGEGISAENLEKMRAAFFTTKDSGDGKRGFGLGLAICRKIVHLHGGTLNISSELGKGTTVQVDLPNGQLPVLDIADYEVESVAP